jgi:UDP:flavonoid glycosyltransferase YjiC (YdhE family)
MLGHLFPLMPILEELDRRGHAVSLRTLSSQVEAVRGRGIEAAAIDPRIEAVEMDDWPSRFRLRRQERAVRAFLRRAKLEPIDLQAAIAEARPDALLVDSGTWGALSAAEAWDGKWACFSPFLLPLPSAHAPPYGLGLRPAQNGWGRARDRLLGPVLDRGFSRSVLPALNELRVSLSLPPLAHGYEMFILPPLLLSMTAEPFDYPQPDRPADIVPVGPCPWEPSLELPGELAGADGPIALVTTSSDFQNDGELVDCALAALAEEPFRVVVTMTAGGVAPSKVPRNATVVDFAPHIPLLERGLCAITHGGMGATQKALAMGVPVCAVPFGRDQFEVARRVENAGAGSYLPARRLSPARLRAKVHDAIAKRAGAELVARAFAAAGGARTAVDAYEERLDLSPPLTTA